MRSFAISIGGDTQRTVVTGCQFVAIGNRVLPHPDARPGWPGWRLRLTQGLAEALAAISPRCK